MPPASIAASASIRPGGAALEEVDTSASRSSTVGDAMLLTRRARWAVA
jgi:hypothetical protein